MRSVGQTAAVALLAAALLGWNLGGQYLWQDEAATAVLAQRMLRYGKPLAYDGRNLITMDYDSPPELDRLAERTSTAEAGIRYFAERGDYKADTTWIGQPWGQFVLAAASFQLFGDGTWQARFPFVLCGIAAVVVLFIFVRSRFGELTAWLAVALLLGNAYWMLHMRQCRYYAPSSLFLLLTFVSYWRWQENRGWGRTLFVLFAWLLFQCDYGTFVPAVAVLLIESLLSGRRPRWESSLLAGALFATVIPWFFYYELGNRFKTPVAPGWVRFVALWYNTNQFVIPLLLLAGALATAWFDRPPDAEKETSRRWIVVVAVLLIAVIVAWMAIVSPFPFLRYVIGVAPLAAWLTAYVLVAAAGAIARLLRQPNWKPGIAVSGAMVLILTPLVALPVSALVPQRLRPARLSYIVRPELQRLWDSYTGATPDPTRDLVAVLHLLLRPDDEILVNGDDTPLMFYTGNRVRGGTPGFRIDDPATLPPKFVVVRQLTGGRAGKIMREYFSRYKWVNIPCDILDCPQANCPDPWTNYLDQKHPPWSIRIAQLSAMQTPPAQPRGPSRAP